jgi:DNA-binding CsgD family transcriptional regulator
VLFGREQEKQILARLLEEARGGRSAAVAIVGEAGAGKSALLQDLRQEASDALLLEAQGVETESELPFATLDQLLRPLRADIEHLPPSRAAPLRGALGLSDGASSDSYGVALSILALLSDAGSGRPVLCLVDDAQWMDRASEHALLFVARRVLAEGVVMVLAGRENEFGVRGLRELRVGPLDTAATAKILTDRSGVLVKREVSERLAVETGGNALAIVELATLLTEDQLRGREELPNPLPMSLGVERLFAYQVNALPQDTRRLLLIAAADDSGRPDIIFAAAQRLSLEASTLDPAEEMGLIKIGPKEVRFRHPLVRSAVYGTALFSERQLAHQTLAGVLKQAGEVDRYAWHLAAATVEPDPQVVHELELAAERARTRNADAAAAAALERAAGLASSSQERGRLLAQAAADAWMAGILPQAERLIDAAQSYVDDPVILANCYRLRGAVELASGSATTSVRRFVEAARHTAKLDPRRSLELLTLAGEGAWLALDADTSIQVGEVADSLDVKEEDRDRFFARLLVGFSRHFSHESDSIRAMRDAIQVARDEHDDVDLLLAAGRAAFYVGDDEGAERFHARIVSRARSISSIGCLAIGGTRLALAELLTGQWNTGLATAEETSRLAEDTGQEELAAHALVWRGLVAAWRGDEDDCRRLLERARAITATRRMRLVDDASLWAEGVLELGAGRPMAAFERLVSIVHPVIATTAALDRIEAGEQVDKREETATWLDHLEAFAAASAAPWALARVAHCRGLLAAEPSEAQAHYEEALKHHVQANRPFERARTELAYGAYLRRLRKRLMARSHLRSALETFHSLGAAPWARRAGSELRATGETVRMRDPSTMSQLTSQELQVVQLVRGGMSNREVAGRLFLSPRTIDFHLRNAYAKLGVSSRSQLAALPVVK